MSEITNDIFHEKKHTLTSPFGKRAVISTENGKTSSFHSGADYGTFGEKIPQYAVCDGTVISSGTDKAYGGAKYVWVKYPSLKVKMLHYHLDKICVEPGQSVTQNTVLGTTGKTGMATGIHLHLGIKNLNGGNYIDPEQWSKTRYTILKKNNAEKTKEYKAGNYVVNTALLFVRCGAGVCFRAKCFNELTDDAKTKISALTGKKLGGYVKGLKFSVSEVKEAEGLTWGKTPSGWVCLNYCEAI